MFDRSLRDRERQAGLGENPEAQTEYLLARVRLGTITIRELVIQALCGNEAAQAAYNNELSRGTTQPVQLSQDDLNQAIRKIFHGIDISQTSREFLGSILQHDREARATLNYYELIQEDDVPPPDTTTALKALFDDLRNVPTHVVAISQMQKPVLQIIPVYEHEGAGLQRMLNALDARRREGQQYTHVRAELMDSLGMYNGKVGKIVGWQVVVVEGATVLDRESNPYAGEPLEVKEHDELTGQLPSWQKDCHDRGLQLCNMRMYTLLQMQELRNANGTPLDRGGSWTVLENPARQRGWLVTFAFWDAGRVYFSEELSKYEYDYTRFRPAVVVNVIGGL
jgi:hypothetical protein